MAGKTNLSDYRFSIFINNDQAKRSLIEMENTMIGYEAELKKLVLEGKQNTTEYIQRKEAISKLDTAMVAMRKEAGLQALSLKELKSLQSQLRNEMARAIPGSEHRVKLEKEFSAVNTRVTELTNGAKKTGMSFGSMADGFNKYFAIVTAGLAVFSGFAISVKSMITAQGELDDSLADIRKTTGMTAAEVQNLNKQLGKIDTRTSRQDLRAMAVVAGQLGIATNDVYSFVNSVDKLNVALGDEITGGAEEVAKTMGTLRNVLTDMKSANISDDMLRLGNAVNVLGAAGFATAPVVSDFANRIGGIGISLGLTSDEVLGLSATLQELSVSTERGGTAVTKILQKMTTNVGDFAKIAGMPMKEFTDLVNKDLFGAFTKVLEGSKQGGQSATLLAGIIKELEISGAGASEVFAKVGNNIKMLNEKVTLAGNALQNTDSIMNEFNLKNATLGAVLDKLSKSFYSLITMPGVTEFFKNQLYHVVEFVNWIKNLPEFIEKYKLSLIVLTGVMGAWIAAMTRSLQVSLLNNLMLKEGILLKIKDAIVLEYLIVKEQMLIIWKAEGTTATKLAATAQWLWNAALSANPIGLVIAAVTALVVVVKAYEKYNSEALALDKLKVDTTVLLTHANTKLEESYSTIEAQARRISKLSADEKKDLQDKTDLTIKEAEANLLLMEAKQKAIGKAAAKPTYWQIVKTQFSIPGITNNNQEEEQRNLGVYAYQNQKEATAPFDDEIKKLRDGIEKLKTERQNIVNVINAESAGDQILGKLAPQLEEKLQNYQVALRNYIAGSEEYIRIQDKIKDVNKELAKYNDAGGGSDPTGNQIKKAKDLQKQLEEILAQGIKDEHERELKMAELNHKQKLAEITGNSKVEIELRKALDAAYEVEKEKINKKYSDKELSDAFKLEKDKLEAKISSLEKGEADWYVYSSELLDKQRDYELANTELTEKEKLDIREKYRFLQAKLDSDFEGPMAPATGQPAKASSTPTSGKSRNVDLLTQLAEKKALLAKSRDEEIAGTYDNADAQKKIWEDYYKSIADANLEFADKVLSTMSQVVNAISAVFQAISASEDAQLKKDEESNNKKKANLKSQLDNKKISQKQYDAAIIKMDQEADAKHKEIAHKQAVRQKEIAVFNATIALLQAIIQAANIAPPADIVFPIIIAALMGVQLAALIATPVPAAAEGRYDVIKKSRQAASGRYSVMGKDDGKQYNNIPFLEDPQSGVYSTPTLFAETGREIILNPKHTENLMRFQPGLLDAIMRVPQRASGLYQDTGAQRTTANVPVVFGFDPATLNALEKFQKTLEKPIGANIVYDNLIDSMIRVTEIQGNVSR